MLSFSGELDSCRAVKKQAQTQNDMRVLASEMTASDIGAAYLHDDRYKFRLILTDFVRVASLVRPR